MSAVPVKPKRAASIARYTLLVGFDAEWRPHDRTLISIQFSVRSADGTLVSRVFYPQVPKLDCVACFTFLHEFLKSVDRLPVRHRGRRRVALISHFAAAELSVFDDALGEMKIRQIGKAHHARMPDMHDNKTNDLWQVQIVDLYSFYEASLGEIGKMVGLEKLEEDRLQLELLLKQDRTRFERYAERDAEIALEAFARFRRHTLETCGIDVLTKPTLPSLASELFRRKYMDRVPVQHRVNVVPQQRRGKRGWRQTTTRVSLYDGSRELREAALASYFGARVEAYVRGLVDEPVVEFDVVSLYPHAALLQPLPHCDTRWIQVIDVAQLDVMEGFGVFTFSFPKGTQYPCLPVKGRALTFPLQGETRCTFAEVRVARRLGATVRVVNAWGFVPGAAERDHDVGKYMRDWLRIKDAAQKGTLEYETAKLFLNGLIGKFAERRTSNALLDFERIGRASGHTGLGGLVARSSALRVALRGPVAVGNLWMPEWATLILGRSRALMAGIIAQGALLVSTDSVIVRASALPICPEIEELLMVGSDLRRETEGDAVFIARSRLYAILRRTDRLPADTRVIARNDRWAVVRAARHGTPETNQQFGETVLRCIAAGRDVAQEREKTRLLSAEGAVRSGLSINEEVKRTGKTHFNWDGKRRLLDRDVNLFSSYTETAPYISLRKLEAAERNPLVRKGLVRKVRRSRSPETLARVLEMIEQGLSAREIEKRTGVPKSTVSDLKKKTSSAVG